MSKLNNNKNLNEILNVARQKMLNIINVKYAHLRYE